MEAREVKKKGSVLSKIRKLPIILIIIIIGLPLLTFVMDPTALKNFFGGGNQDNVGEVAGEKITRTEFVRALDGYKKQVGSQVSDIQASKNVYNSLVREKVYKNQLEQAGITIGEADIFNDLCDKSFIKNDQRFQTAGVFDKTKFKQYLADVKENRKEEWASWQNYMKGLKSNLEKDTYNNLVSAGLGASLKEGEVEYNFYNTKIIADFVYVPFSSIDDSKVAISKDEVKDYIEKHQSEFEVEASRDIKIVRFDVKPTTKDEVDLKTKVASLINNREEYSSVAKSNIEVKGLKSTNDYDTFFIDNKSDLSYNKNFQYKNDITSSISEELFKGEKGNVYGPYKEGGYMKLSKIVDIKMLPDSVKAHHILIPFVGARNAQTTKTEDQAKKTADSLLTVAKLGKVKFETLAKDYSKGPSADKGGDLGWFTYRTMVPEFRDYCFLNKKGDIGVVKTMFGYHVVKIDDQKNIQKALKLATYGQKIEASEETENQVFEKASLFEQKLADGKAFDDIAKEKSLLVSTAVGLKSLDEKVPNLGNQRSIINWAFEKDVNKGDYKRFDIENGYVIAIVTEKTPKGLMPVDKAMAKVRPILMKEKKAERIAETMIGATLEEMANNTKRTVRKADVTMKTPTISGVGYEPNIVGAMVYMPENKITNGIVGNNGVFAVKVITKEAPRALQNYNTERKRIANQRKNKTYKIYDAIKKSSEVKDGLTNFYGIAE